MRANVAYIPNNNVLIGHVRRNPMVSGKYKLFECEKDGERAFFLKTKAMKRLGVPVESIFKAASKGGTLTLEGREGVWNILAVQEEETLLSFVHPVKTHSKRVPTNAIFWCETQEQVQSLIVNSMSLGNDNIQFCSKDRDGVPYHLVRIHNPSTYLMTTAVEVDGVHVSVPQANGRIYVPYGSSLPLENLLIPDNGVMFYEGTGLNSSHILHEEMIWENMYTLTGFKLADISTSEQWGDAGKPDPFEVTLRLEKDYNKRNTSLWLLDMSDLPVLEQMLDNIPEALLGSVQYTLQQDNEGVQRLLVRELHEGKGRKFFEFEGREFAEYMGFPNLYLESNARLEPTLRKDSYRKLFKLDRAKISLFWKDDEGSHSIRIDKNRFRPLSDIVHYLIASEQSDFDEMSHRSFFRFPSLKNSVYRTPVAAGEPKAEKKAKKKKKEQSVALPEVPVFVNTYTESAAFVEEIEPEEEVVEAPIVLTQTQKEEVEVEELLLGEGADYDTWLQLADIKNRLDKPEDRVQCLMEALWFASTPEQKTSTKELLVTAIRSLPTIAADISPIRDMDKGLLDLCNGTSGRVLHFWLWNLLKAESVKKNVEAASNSGALQDWVSEVTAYLAKRQDVSKRDRWLIWSEVFDLNQDETARAKVRESLLESLNEGGVKPYEIPSFLIHRLQHFQMDEDEEGEDENTLLALKNLDLLASYCDENYDSEMKYATHAALALSYRVAGELVKSHNHAEEARKFLEDDALCRNCPELHAWIAMELGYLSNIDATGSGEELIQITRDYLEKNPGNSIVSKTSLEDALKSKPSRIKGEIDPDAFAIAQSRSVYPNPAKYQIAQGILNGLNESIGEGDFSSVLVKLQAAAKRIAKKTTGMKGRSLAYSCREFLSVMRKANIRGSDAIDVLRNLEEGIIQENQMQGLYPILMKVHLGEGFADNGELEHGSNLLKEACNDTWDRTTTTQWLDLLDTLVNVMYGVEVIPMSHRHDAIEEILKALHIKNKHEEDSESYRLIKLGIIDHLTEVCCSQNKLHESNLKKYLEEAEFYLRQGVLN